MYNITVKPKRNLDMSDNKHPFFSVIAMAAAFGAFVWIGAEEFRIKPLQETKSDLIQKVSKLESEATSSPEYRELERVHLETSSLHKAEIKQLRTEKARLEEAIREKDAAIEQLTTKVSIVNHIQELGIKQDVAQKKIASILTGFQPQHRASEIKLFQGQISRIQEQIKVLSASLGKKA